MAPSQAKSDVDADANAHADQAFPSFEADLDKTTVDSAPFPPSGDYVIRDASLKGFGLRISPGSKTWIVRRKLGGRSFRHTLGQYPAMTVVNARREAQKALGFSHKGTPPW
ncbi:MAG: DUF4102 domain-containing protein [Betaproteobacteria bacterium]|nr:DUF4102 domain-containing protein [Betaproteobacteria bacterium]